MLWFLFYITLHWLTARQVWSTPLKKKCYLYWKNSSMFTRCLHYMTLQLMTDCSLLTRAVKIAQKWHSNVRLEKNHEFELFEYRVFGYISNEYSNFEYVCRLVESAGGPRLPAGHFLTLKRGTSRTDRGSFTKQLGACTAGEFFHIQILWGTSRTNRGSLTKQIGACVTERWHLDIYMTRMTQAWKGK